jgi:hypothetical protein
LPATYVRFAPQPVGYRENRLMRPLAARSALQHNIFAAVENFCDLGEIALVRPRDGLGDMHRIWDAIVHDGGGDIRRYDQNSNTAFRQGCLAGNYRLPPRLFRRMYHVAEDAAVPVDLREVDFLDEIEAQFVANDLTCNGRLIAIGLEDFIDEMQASGITAPGDCSQAMGYLRFGLLGKRSRFFVSHRHPLDFAFFERTSDQVERVAHDVVTVLDACALVSTMMSAPIIQTLLFLPQYAPNCRPSACIGVRGLGSDCADSANARRYRF